MSALDDFINEIRCYDENWFDELQGRSAKQELSALRSRIAELEALTTWQPIETTPDSGEILAYKKVCEIDALNYSVSYDAYEVIDGYFAHDGLMLPTHWMPLPKPPEEQE